MYILLDVSRDFRVNLKGKPYIDEALFFYEVKSYRFLSGIQKKFEFFFNR